MSQVAVLSDVAWVLGTLALAAAAPCALSTAGWAAATVVAVIVAGMAMTQAVGLGRNKT